MTMNYDFSAKFPATMAEAVTRVTEALKAQGFGVLTDIDVEAVLKARLGVEFRPYRILGACSPGLAHRALLAEDKVGLLLPCNVVVQDVGAGMVEVSAVDPVAMIPTIDNPDLARVAIEARNKLRAMVESL